MSSPPPHRGRWGRWGAVTCELGPGRSAPGLPAGAGGFLPPASRAVCPPLRLWRGRQPGRCLLRPLLPPPAELQSAPPGPTPPRPRRTWWPQPGSTSETVAPACRIPVGDEARGPSPSGSRPGCANGRHPSCRSTQPLHSDPDAGALGCLWRFPARAAHERQLWTDPRRACGGSGREVCTLEVARGAAELAQRNRLSEAFQGAAPVGTPTPARARPETWGSRCLCGKFICS